MSFVHNAGSFIDLATLRRTRALLRTPRGRVLAAAIAGVYAIVSMLVGEMLEFYGSGTQASWTFAVINQPSGPAWDYPALIVQWPSGILVLPYLPAITMVVVSIGVGIGAAAALLLFLPLLSSRFASRHVAAASTAAGVSPAITGVATLGACCCTGCVGTAGLAVVAAASGSNLSTLVLNSWYVDLFELVVVWISLMVQERGLTPRPGSRYAPPPPMDARFLLGTLLRIALLIAGITWSLSMFVEWTTTSPLTASSALWYHWIFEHQLLALLAIGAGLFPQELFLDGARSLRAWIGRWGTGGARILLLAAGITWGIGVPPALVHLGLGGFVNELLGYLGSGSPWAESPDAPLGAALLFHWGLQHFLLAAFAVTVAARPSLALLPLTWTVSSEGRADTPSGRPSGPSDPSGRAERDRPRTTSGSLTDCVPSRPPADSGVWKVPSSED
ncbi:MAG: hypothetical protein KGJ23_00915 [Euryarchaeota archaeon]|nr:hypothetical protein [Euryarchaeota archaeon]MDE1835157.1 hypothetical protein [Euryarchaeota archaeon]MDE1880432.1 hypothetical protein [Euryarchaeota archaeon]